MKIFLSSKKNERRQVNEKFYKLERYIGIVASFPGLPPHAPNVTRKKIAKLGVTLCACGGRPGNEAIGIQSFYMFMLRLAIIIIYYNLIYSCFSST